jgi:aspartate beta-hydroxylase
MHRTPPGSGESRGPLGGLVPSDVHQHWFMLAPMASESRDARSLSVEGMEALRRGDARAARELFERAIATGAADGDTWFALSLAHDRLGHSAEESAAVDKVLELNPRHLPALIRKGDLYTRRTDRRAATTFYTAAIRIGGAIPDLSADWRGELARIEALCQHNSSAFEEHLLADLTRSGLGTPGTERFGHAMDLLLGRRRIFLQQPRYFHFPELPQIQFYDRAQFPWAGAIERETAAIRKELQGVLARGAGIMPYMQKEADRPAFDNNGLLNDPAWSAFHLIRDGKPVAASAQLCPNTMNALRHLPLCEVKGRTPTVLFSLLRPGAHIPPHNGYLNTRLICHLPLIVPPECALRVGNETRPWREGELTIFDDTIEHEAWNRSSQLRVVLLFDIWRPELSEMERSLVAGMLESIDRFGGNRREWTQ